MVARLACRWVDDLVASMAASMVGVRVASMAVCWENDWVGRMGNWKAVVKDDWKVAVKVDWKVAVMAEPMVVWTAVAKDELLVR